MLWGKCRKLLLNRYIHYFRVTNGTIKLKTMENGPVYAVTHRNDLVELFPDNEILADQVKAVRLFLKLCCNCVSNKFLEFIISVLFFKLHV